MNLTLLVTQGRPEGKRLAFPLGEYYFGRGTECHVRPNSDWVSRQHCLLRVTGDDVLVRDLGSTNGTLVNGTRVIEDRELHDGDVLQVGPLTLQVVVAEPEAPPPANTVSDAPLMQVEETVADPPPPKG